MDNIYEQLSRVGKSPVYSTMKLLSYIFFALGTVSVIAFNLLPAVVLLMSGFILYFLKKKFFLEYEYAFIKGKIDIDVIEEKKKRKKLISFSVKDIEAYGEEISSGIKKYERMGSLINAVATNDKNTVYGIYVINENQKYYIRLTPDRKLYDLINQNNRRAEIK